MRQCGLSLPARKPGLSDHGKTAVQGAKAINVLRSGIRPLLADSLRLVIVTVTTIKI